MTSEKVELLAPEIAGYGPGNTGIPYAYSFVGGIPGPHVVISALMHGNELCGAYVLDALLQAGLRPRRGRLSLVFCNVDAFHSFEPDNPGASRYLDEDMNRLWSAEILDGGRDSRERQRVRALRPLFDQADLVLDLHSMQQDAPPLLLCGRQPRSLDLARRIGCPAWVVADAGHVAGPRLIDYARFTDPAGTAMAVLAECGQHWRAAAVPMALETTARFLLHSGIVAPEDVAPWLTLPPQPPVRAVQVTHAITVDSSRFHFLAAFTGMDVVPTAGTLIALDGLREIRTPYDDCLLIMPARRLVRGQTAVRLGRLLP
ncbi:succinylglutamate desuccinylase/aspartoacylase domain-containing protein [Oleisolibacter albus]|uniref:succinylglutamate desuccinylase/aspartoacylase domain-containing protein n=1 Tax=Oleisolibacter albus TaxID=2171757 RepID=UPI000DF295B2|nr:succinylglutamate desuccinylase/aspartoacylase family protein [Oleisolibacter albus]